MLKYDRISQIDFLKAEAADFKSKLELLHQPITHQHYEYYRHRFTKAGDVDPDKTLKKIFNL